MGIRRTGTRTLQPKKKPHADAALSELVATILAYLGNRGPATVTLESSPWCRTSWQAVKLECLSFLSFSSFFVPIWWFSFPSHFAVALP